MQPFSPGFHATPAEKQNLFQTAQLASKQRPRRERYLEVLVKAQRRRRTGKEAGLCAFPEPQFCARGKYSLQTWVRFSPSGQRCWRRRGVTRAGPGMRAVAAAAAAAAGAVTAGGGRPRRRAQSLVWPAGSSWPDSCARSRVAPVLRGFHRAEATPPIVWLLNWQTLGSPRGGEPKGGGGSARLRPDSLSMPQCQSPRRCSRPSTRSGGLGEAPERPDGVDGTPQRCQGRSETVGQRREEWPSSRRVCAAATKWLERWGEELGGGGQRGPTLPRLGGERTPRTRKKIPPGPRRPRAEICWGMAPSADSPGTPQETQRRKVKTMKKAFSPSVYWARREF